MAQISTEKHLAPTGAQFVEGSSGSRGKWRCEWTKVDHVPLDISSLLVGLESITPLIRIIYDSLREQNRSKCLLYKET